MEVALRAFRWIDDYLEYTLSFLFYVYLTAIIFIEVIRRYILNDSSSWGQETAIYAFIWMTYIATAKGVKERTHLSVTILVDRFGRNGKFATAMLSDVCFFVLAAVVFYYSAVALSQSIEFGQTMRGVRLPMWLALVGVPLGWLLIMFRVVERSVKMIRAYIRGEEIDTAGANISE